RPRPHALAQGLRQARDDRLADGRPATTPQIGSGFQTGSESEERMSATGENAITEHEAAQVERANASGKSPVVFVHGLWLLPSSWQRWADHFEQNGFAALTPGWPDDPETIAEAKEHPEVFAGKSIGDVADHFETVIRSLYRRPAI